MSAPLPSTRQLVAARRSLRQLEASAQRHDTRHGTARLRWRRWGQGPSLVMLHGGHGCWMHWVRNIEALAQHFTLWLPDMPGFGDSDDLPCDAHDPERQAQLVATLNEGLAQLPGLDAQFLLAGFSFGGFVAAQLAAQNPRVRRLALLGSAGHGGPRRQAQELLNWRLTQGSQRWQAHAQNLQTLMLHDPLAVDAQALVLHGCASHHTRYRSKAISRAGRLGEMLSGFDRELLLLWGEHDVTAHPRDIGPQLQAGRPERQLHLVEGAGHWVQYERAPETNAVLIDWLARPSV